MKIKYSIHYKTREVGKVTRRHQIRLRFSFNGQRTDIITGWNLDDINAWDPDLELVKRGYEGAHGETAADINTNLQLIKENVESSFRYFEALDIMPSTEDIVNRYKERMAGIAPKVSKEEKKKVKKMSLFNVFDLFTQECGEKNAWTKATFQKMATLKTDLNTFDRKLTLEELDESKLTSFVKYLREEKVLHSPKKKKDDKEGKSGEDDVVGIMNSTIDKKLGYLRWFLKWAEAKGYNVNQDYKTFKPTLKSTQKKVIYLTKEELRKLQKCEIPPEHTYLEAIRDVFLFCCFSGLRHSDVYNLRRTDIKGDHIDITTVKTADSISIELNDITRGIIEKYKNVPFPGSKVLPVIQNQPMNRALKELCKIAEIDEEIRITTYSGNQRKDEIKKKWELIGTHTGRRTFIVNALSLGITPNVVMKWTGHSDYSSMKPYIDIVDSIKANEMTKLNTLL